MKVIELYNKLSEIIPPSLSCSWDRDGLESCPEPEREVKRVLISLDTTNEVIDKAIADGADVIVSHHPLFFGGLGNINTLTFDGARAVKLAKHNIATMSFHTRLDALEGGVNDILAELIGLKNVETVGDEGIVRIGELSAELDVMDFAKSVKERLSCGQSEKEARVAICPANRSVKRVAVLGGSGGDDIRVAAQAGADTYLTGELKYHERLSAADFGVNLVCAGHFFTEYPVCAFLERTVKALLPEARVEVVFSNTIVEI
ncbi:MAG: Nif3-like dinuclear metal center hexameric protein [Clostridia bacterium]|nr:Nif3-like dinuclear metal center hexameric protein [Clostridia bacterium]